MKGREEEKKRKRKRKRKEQQFLFNTFPPQSQEREKKKKKKTGWLAGVMNLSCSKITADMRYFLVPHSSQILIKYFDTFYHLKVIT
jgi:hypothetical protein